MIDLPQELIIQFVTAVIESVLYTSITVWFGLATKSDISRLQWTVKMAERIISVPLLNLQDLYNCRVKKWAGNIIKDPALLPSGRSYRSLCTKTSRISKKIFFSQASFFSQVAH